MLSATDQRCRWAPGEREHLAVDSGTVQLTYDQLDVGANRLARHLRDNGVGPGDQVGLIFDDPVRSYLAILAAVRRADRSAGLR